MTAIKYLSSLLLSTLEITNLQVALISMERHFEEVGRPEQVLHKMSNKEMKQKIVPQPEKKKKREKPYFSRRGNQTRVSQMRKKERSIQIIFPFCNQVSSSFNMAVSKIKLEGKITKAQQICRVKRRKQKLCFSKCKFNLYIKLFRHQQFRTHSGNSVQDSVKFSCIAIPHLPNEERAILS